MIPAVPGPLTVELPSDSEVRVTRVFRAPRRLVWAAHTRPDLLRRWMLGPDGWTMSVCEVDLRVDGTYRYRWRSEVDGQEFGFHGVHREVVEHERVVTTEWMDGVPGDGARNTLVLAERAGVTTLTLTMDFGTKEARDGAVATGMTDGMEAGYRRLDGMVAVDALTVTPVGDSDLLFRRSFRAPRQLVWDAHTRPELVRRWLLGPEGWTMPVCEIDLRPGGRFRYVWRNADGRDMGMGGTFRTIDAPALLVHDELFDEDWTGGSTVVTQRFEEQDGVTTLTMTVAYPSAEARAGALGTGMTGGMESGYGRLDVLVAELSATAG